MLAKRLVASLVVLISLAFPAVVGAAIELQIVNGTSSEDIYVSVHGAGYDVEGINQDEPKLLSEIPGGTLTVNKLVSGRVYISYGAPVIEGVTFASPTRFDWAELTVTPAPEDKANLTAVDQFAIGMRMEALNGSDETLETLGDANSDTIFNALQQIPGGPLATVRDSGNNILRVLSPVHSTAYPDLGDYVRGMAGQTITLHTAFYGNPFTVTEYSGTFAADGSIALHGTYDSASPPPLAEPPPPTIEFPASQLIPEIYAPVSGNNNAEAAIRRDVLAGFSTGLWGGRYGNDALSFCTDPLQKPQGWICPEGFNKPAFGDARAKLEPYATCEQYAAVINQYSDSYGNAYSDASKNTTVSLDQANVAKLRVTILPDSGNAGPVNSGNPNCGAAPPAHPAGPTTTSNTAARVKLLKLFKKARFKRRRARVGRIVCVGRCGRVRLVAKKGRRPVGRSRTAVKSSHSPLSLHLTRAGKRLLAHKRRVRAKVTAWVTLPGGKTVRRQRRMLLIDKTARRHRRH